MALVDIINQNSATDLAATATKTETLGKNDFLQLLVTQLKYQDPLEPLKNEEFVAQLAQFNSLEQMMNLNTSFDKMYKVQSLSQATSLVGQPVVYQNDAGEFITGVAASVVVENGIPALIVGSDKVPLENITGLGLATSTSVLSQASFLIGKQVSWMDANDTEQSGVVSSVVLTDGGIPQIVIGSGAGSKTIGLSDIIAVSQPTT